MQPVIETRRLILRPFGPGDAGDVQRLAGRREVSETTSYIPHPYEDGMAEAWIESHTAAWADRARVSYAVTARDSGQLVGAVSLSRIDKEAAELGYWIGLPFWGEGYCTEAAAELLKLAPVEFGIFEIRAVHLLANPASGRVLQKLGLIHVADERIPGRHGTMVEVGVYTGDLRNLFLEQAG
ncbi:MAG: GNAT family N-acetyltransferase [Xanthomonadales bacterium]|jgi:RimJ/RimL family protein N-acetyltransferase|nr:GNAT family N-acetyltransferase [Xanthomonadales bacterium]